MIHGDAIGECRTSCDVHVIRGDAIGECSTSCDLHVSYIKGSQASSALSYSVTSLYTSVITH